MYPVGTPLTILVFALQVVLGAMSQPSEGSTPAAKLGLWVNLAKNPRFKTIFIPALGLTAELPKPLALASIAVRCVAYSPTRS